MKERRQCQWLAVRQKISKFVGQGKERAISHTESNYDEIETLNI